jgi:hypothetical protein
MNLSAKFVFEGRWARWAAGLLFVLALFSAAQSHAADTRDEGHRAEATVKDAARNAPAAVVPAISRSKNHLEITNYFMNYAGDHSLEVATVIEQPTAGYTKYIVQLHLASGAEQSVVLTAPPGGLQVEMRDMTGDKVANDVILRPALIRWIPTVLVNDGHEHFKVAMSGRDPSSFSSSADLGSRRRDPQTFALLMSSGFEAVYLPAYRRLFDAQLQECLFSSFSQAVCNRLGHASSPGRAPPLPTTI